MQFECHSGGKSASRYVLLNSGLICSMEHFNKITYEEDTCTLVINNYDLSNIDYFGVLKGKPYNGPPISNVKLYVTGTPCDLVGGPLSWLICSDRLVQLFGRKASSDYEVFEAPLFEKNEEPVNGYKIINPVRLLPCLDIEKSVFFGKKIKKVKKWAIQRDKVPHNVHMFRVKESPYAVFITDTLLDGLKGKGLRGIGFLRYEAV